MNRWAFQVHMYNTNEFGTETMYDYYIVMKFISW
jgi:hypothetical protein